MKTLLSQKTVNYAAARICPAHIGLVLGVMRTPFPVPSDMFINYNACQRLPSCPALCPARDAGGALGDRHRRRNGKATAECTARAPKGKEVCRVSKYCVAFGNQDFPLSGKGRAACLQQQSEALGGSWGKIGICSAAGEKGWNGGETALQVWDASRQGWQLQQSGVYKRGKSALPFYELHFFSSPPGSSFLHSAGRQRLRHGFKARLSVLWASLESRHRPAWATPALPLTAALSPSRAGAGGPAPPCRALPCLPAGRPLLPGARPAARRQQLPAPRAKGASWAEREAPGWGPGPAPRGSPCSSRTRGTPLPALLAGGATPPRAPRLDTLRLSARGSAPGRGTRRGLAGGGMDCSRLWLPGSLKPSTSQQAVAQGQALARPRVFKRRCCFVAPMQRWAFAKMLSLSAVRFFDIQLSSLTLGQRGSG